MLEVQRLLERITEYRRLLDVASLDDLPFAVRTFMKWYRYRTLEWRGARLSRPLAESKVAVVTTAGLSAPGQAPFDRALKVGDSSWREIRLQDPVQDLVCGHRSNAFDHEGLDRDRNLALPLDRLREMRQSGVIGAINHRHFSFMGSIVRPAPLVEKTAPEVADRLVEDDVQAVLLTPF